MDPTDVNLRLVVIPKRDLEKFVQLSIDYRQEPDQSWTGGSSIGFLSDITNELDQRINIWHISHGMRGINRLSEEGRIRILGEASEGLRDFSGIEENIKKKSANSFTTEFWGRQLSPFTVFISLKGDFAQRDDLISLCHEEGEKLGLPQQSLVSVKSHSSPVTSTVTSVIRNCDGMIQFYVDDTTEDDKFIWLQAEYLAACSRNIPCIRIIDPSRKDQIVIDKDKSYLNMKMSSSLKEKREIINTAFSELITYMRRTIS